MSLKKVVSSLLDEGIQDYVAQVGEMVLGDEVYWQLDELDDLLLEQVEEHPVQVLEAAKAHFKLFPKIIDKDARHNLTAYCYNLATAAAINIPDVEEAKKYFSEGLSYALEVGEPLAGESLSKNFLRGAFRRISSLDDIPYFYACILDFYKKQEFFLKMNEVLLAAADYFIDVHAYDSAKRALMDCFDLLKEHEDESQEILLLEKYGILLGYEGDLERSMIVLEKCKDMCHRLERPVSYVTRTNLAYIYMNKGEYEKAKEYYLHILDEISGSTDTHTILYTVLTNLLICKRELKEISSVDEYVKQMNQIGSEFSEEQRIEANLVVSKTYLSLGNKAKGALYLRNACEDVQRFLDLNSRLHYRRNIRDKYINRVKGLLANVEKEGDISEIITVLSFCASNSLVDWLAALDWIEGVLATEGVSEADKRALSKSQDELIAFGTPFLYGFREKYDDPLECSQVAEGVDYSRPWREFNAVVQRIQSHCDVGGIYDGATIDAQAERIGEKLKNSLVVFALSSEHAFQLFVLDREKYYVHDFPIAVALDHWKAVWGYQAKEIDRSAFVKSLSDTQNSIASCVEEIVRLSDNSDVKDIVVFEDIISEGLPIPSSLLSYENIRQKILRGELCLTNCHAAYFSCKNRKEYSSAAFVFRKSDGLHLVGGERNVLERSKSACEVAAFDLSEAKFEMGDEVEILHFSSHCVPASLFTDPIFVSTDTDFSKNCLCLEALQRCGHKTRLQFVVLNGCNTGTSSSKNYHKVFRTSEKIGFSSVLLLNRKCVVLATQWPQMDLPAYVFSVLFYEAVDCGFAPSNAYAMSLAKMYELDKASLLEILSQIPDDQERFAKCEGIKSSREEYPLRNAFVLGMLHCHSLLIPLAGAGGLG